MNVGSPSTSLGGLFYFISVAVMLVKEVGLTLLGRGSRGRWRVVLTETGIVIGILCSFFGAGWLIKELFHIQITTLRLNLVTVTGITADSPFYSLFMVALPLLITISPLLVILAIIRILRIFVKPPAQSQLLLTPESER